jgi:hypothetical protein
VAATASATAGFKNQPLYVSCMSALKLKEFRMAHKDFIPHKSTKAFDQSFTNFCYDNKDLGIGRMPFITDGSVTRRYVPTNHAGHTPATPLHGVVTPGGTLLSPGGYGFGGMGMGATTTGGSVGTPALKRRSSLTRDLNVSSHGGPLPVDKNSVSHQIAAAAGAGNVAGGTGPPGGKASALSSSLWEELSSESKPVTWGHIVSQFKTLDMETLQASAGSSRAEAPASRSHSPPPGPSGVIIPLFTKVHEVATTNDAASSGVVGGAIDTTTTKQDSAEVQTEGSIPPTTTMTGMRDKV